jgi:hypothetical protein
MFITLLNLKTLAFEFCAYNIKLNKAESGIRLYTETCEQTRERGPVFTDKGTRVHGHLYRDPDTCHADTCTQSSAHGHVYYCIKARVREHLYTDTDKCTFTRFRGLVLEGTCARENGRIRVHGQVYMSAEHVFTCPCQWARTRLNGHVYVYICKQAPYHGQAYTQKRVADTCTRSHKCLDICTRICEHA